MTRSIFNRGIIRAIARCGFILAALLLSAPALLAQIPGNAQTLSDECSGPLGALLPQCQAARTTTDLPVTTVTTPGVPVGSQVTIAPSAGGDSGPSAGASEMRAVPPEPPGEFQRYVASSVGDILPIFGASLFGKVPTTFAPLDRVPVTADYAIGPGDEILLRVWGQVNMDVRLPVDRAGAVYIPQVGNVAVSGMQFRQLPDYLKSQLERVYRNFDLSVNMGQLRSIQVYVVGQARQPGTYTVSSLSTLVTVLFASGGPSSRGTMRGIQLKRGTQVVAELDLYDLLLRGDKSGDVRLLPEDVIFIPQAGPQIAAAGNLKSPAIYELKNEKTVGELIQMAGGLTPMADRKRATLERIKDGVSREVLELSLDSESMNLPVMDADVLYVLAITPRFESAVTLRGNVANPGRFRWKAGMRLRDIIPDKESLITRDYWRKRNLLGYIPSEEIVAGSPADEAGRKPKETDIGNGVPDINWSYAVIERQNPQDLLTKLLPFDLGKLVLEKDERHNLELRSGDVVTVFSQNDIRVPQMQQTRVIRLEGEFHAPGVYNVAPGETLGQIIQKAGGLTPQAYLFGAEFMRASVRRDQQERLNQYVQDLEREIEQTAAVRINNAANSDEASLLSARIQTERQRAQRLRALQATGRIILSLQPDSNDIAPIAGMTLENGDRLIVPARPATVNVLGAVYNPNAMMHAEKIRVRDYVRHAGGPTRNADKGRAYVIQADGTVLPKQDLGASFEKKKLNPGDSVVIPEKIMRSTFMSDFRDWTQILFQVGMTAATVAALQ